MMMNRTTDYSERRKYARVDIRSKINFILSEAGDTDAPQEKFQAVGKNMGVEGLLFNSNKKLKPGTLLDMEIFFPYQSQPVKIQGEVRWCQAVKDESTGAISYDTGVKFPVITEDHVFLLVKHICGNLSRDMIRRLNEEAGNEA